MDLDKVRKTEITIDVDIMNDKLLVTYRPFAISASETVKSQLLELTGEKHAKGDPKKIFQSFLDMFCTFVSLWDLTDGDQIVPITPESLRSLPFEFLSMVITAVLADKDARKNYSLMQTGISRKEHELNDLPQEEQDKIIRMHVQDQEG